MKVSIVIPCYRQGRYLQTAIDSCLSQTYKDVEVIVVNDGSDDDTEEVARSYGNRIQYFKKLNGGLCAARNSGIAVATGRYVKFLDADDHLAPDQIEWQMQAIDGRQDRVGVTTARAYRDGSPNEYTDTVPNLQNLIPDMFGFPDIPPHSWLFPMDLVRAVNGFRESYSPAGDWDFTCRVGKRRPTVCCECRVGCYYRLRSGSMSTSNHRGTTVEVARTLIELHDEFRDGPYRTWFGSELLGAEQVIYRGILIRGYEEPELERELLLRIQELWRLVGPPPDVSRKFLTLCKVVGYPLAEQAYSRFVRRMRAKKAGGL